MKEIVKNMNILNELKKLQDIDYKKLQSKIVPNIHSDKIIGVRIPVIRNFAKVISDEDALNFFKILPHNYYDENLLHGILLSRIKDYDVLISELDRFLPYVDNWAVCDTILPKIFKKNRKLLIKEIIRWSKSKNVYECRFGIGMLMRHFLDEDFKQEYLEIPLMVKLDDYYVKMMISWFYATALAKQWDSTISYIKNNKLDVWIHNKTIQKGIESYRISVSQKEYLRKLRR